MVWVQGFQVQLDLQASDSSDVAPTFHQCFFLFMTECEDMSMNVSGWWSTAKFIV